MDGFETGSLPRLLVSVRDAEEARAAVAGGCDILDVKEPSNGSLGAATARRIAEVAEVAQANNLPISAAFGECTDQLAPLDGNHLSLRYFKRGPAGLAGIESWQKRWIDSFREVEALIDRPATTESGENQSAARRVAVIYADSNAAAAPDPELILDALSHESGTPFAGVLVDTFDKSSGTVLDCLSIERLQRIAARAHDAGLFFALAGRLSLRLLPQVTAINADVIAVRSAACVGENRTARVDSEAVQRFRAEMQRVFREHSAIGAAT